MGQITTAVVDTTPTRCSSGGPCRGGGGRHGDTPLGRSATKQEAAPWGMRALLSTAAIAAAALGVACPVLGVTPAQGAPSHLLRWAPHTTSHYILLCLPICLPASARPWWLTLLLPPPPPPLLLLWVCGVRHGARPLPCKPAPRPRVPPWQLHRRSDTATHRPRWRVRLHLSLPQQPGYGVLEGRALRLLPIRLRLREQLRRCGSTAQHHTRRSPARASHLSTPIPRARDPATSATAVAADLD
eukprot:COSAG01_NODE_7987_length_2963_cov_2.214036_3_plen_243_part_00